MKFNEVSWDFLEPFLGRSRGAKNQSIPTKTIKEIHMLFTWGENWENLMAFLVMKTNKKRDIEKFW
jgi:hypothetical protein